MVTRTNLLLNLITLDLTNKLVIGAVNYAITYAYGAFV